MYYVSAQPGKITAFKPVSCICHNYDYTAALTVDFRVSVCSSVTLPGVPLIPLPSATTASVATLAPTLVVIPLLLARMASMAHSKMR